MSVTEYKVAQESRKLADIKQQNNEEQEKNTKLRSNNASISYQIATQEQRHSRNLDVIAADEDRLETVRSSIYAGYALQLLQVLFYLLSHSCHCLYEQSMIHFP